MQIGNLKTYKNVIGTIELADCDGNGYYGNCVIDGITLTYTAGTIEDLYKEFCKAVDKYLDDYPLDEI